MYDKNEILAKILFVTTMSTTKSPYFYNYYFMIPLPILIYKSK